MRAGKGHVGGRDADPRGDGGMGTLVTPLKNSWRELPDCGDHLAIDTSYFAFRFEQMPHICLLENTAQNVRKRGPFTGSQRTNASALMSLFFEVYYLRVHKNI